MTTRDLDLVLYGATGFTGRQSARYLAASEDARPLRWAIAGRSAQKLEELRRELGADVEVVVADAADAPAIGAMVARCRVVASTAGPFAKYGDHVVAACAEHGTSYADITGETTWVRRVIDRHHEAAIRSGARIVPFAGVDSVPADVGTLDLVRRLREDHDQGCASVKAFYSMRGGLNGGTLASALQVFEAGDQELFRDPLLLNPPGHRDPEDAADQADVREAELDEDLGGWTAPFAMAPVNTRVVRRSAALFADAGSAYGSRFRYRESMTIGRGQSRLAHAAIARGSKVFESILGTRLGRRALAALGPEPGEGPSEETMDAGFLRVIFVARGEGGTKLGLELRDRGDPGNRCTVKMFCESALALAVDDLPDTWKGGVLTTATAIGPRLLERLEAAGMTVKRS